MQDTHPAAAAEGEASKARRPSSAFSWLAKKLSSRGRGEEGVKARKGASVATDKPSEIERRPSPYTTADRLTERKSVGAGFMSGGGGGGGGKVLFSRSVSTGSSGLELSKDEAKKRLMSWRKATKGRKKESGTG